MGGTRTRAASAAFWLLVSAWVLMPAAMGRAADFEADEVVASLVVRVKTADEQYAGTDDAVHFDVGTARWQLDTSNHNDFERGSEKDYTLLPTAGMVVQDIHRIQIDKAADGIAGGWKLASVIVYVNGKMLYGSVVNRWLEDDDRTWTASTFEPVEFETLRVSSTSLTDGTVGQAYSATVAGTGGKSPYTWSISVTRNASAWASGPTITAGSSGQATITGRAGSTAATSRVKITLKDSRDVPTSKELDVNFISSLGAPTITSISPSAGWRPLPSGMGIPSSQVTIRGTNFDNRAGKTTVRIGGASATVTSVKDNDEIVAEVPAAAASGLGAIQVTTPYGTVSTASDAFRVQPYGFRAAWGYSFSNFRTEKLSWDLFRETYGSDQVEYTTPLGVVHSPTAALFYEFAFEELAKGGNCHGMTLSSLRLQEGDLGFDEYLPYDASTVYDLTGSVTRGSATGTDSLSPNKTERMINVCHGSQLSLEILLYIATHNRAGNPVKLVSELEGSLPRQLFITNDSLAGHTLIAYAVETSGNTSLIRVYDPNKPFDLTETSDDSSYITVNRTNNTWSYPFDPDNNETWSGPFLFQVPYDRYPIPPTLPTDAADLGLVLFILGDAQAAQLSDGAGHTLFDAAGRVNRDPATQLPRALPLVPFTGASGRGGFFVAPDPVTKALPRLSCEVAGRAEGGKYHALMMGPGGAVYLLSNLDASPTTRDRIAVNPQTGEVELTGGSDKSDLWLDVIRRRAVNGDPVEHDLSAAHLSVRAGDRIAFSQDPARPGLRVRNEGKQAAEFQLLMDTVSHEGRTRHTLGRFRVEPGFSHRFTLADTGEVDQEVTDDATGQPLQTARLTPAELPAAGLYGDVTGDGKLTVSDVLSALQMAVGLVKADAGQTLRADVAPRGGTGTRPVGDGAVTIADVVEILRMVLGLSASAGGTLDAFERPSSFPRLPEIQAESLRVGITTPVYSRPVLGTTDPLTLDPTLVPIPPTP